MLSAYIIVYNNYLCQGFFVPPVVFWFNLVQSTFAIPGISKKSLSGTIFTVKNLYFFLFSAEIVRFYSRTQLFRFFFHQSAVCKVALMTVRAVYYTLSRPVV